MIEKTEDCKFWGENRADHYFEEKTCVLGYAECPQKCTFYGRFNFKDAKNQIRHMHHHIDRDLMDRNLHKRIELAKQRKNLRMIAELLK